MDDNNDGIGAAAWVVISILVWLLVAGAVLFVVLIR